MDKNIYEVYINKETTYYIKAESEEAAIEQAERWFDEMHSEVETCMIEEEDFTDIQKLMGAYIEI